MTRNGKSSRKVRAGGSSGQKLRPRTSPFAASAASGDRSDLGPGTLDFGLRTSDFSRSHRAWLRAFEASPRRPVSEFPGALGPDRALYTPRDTASLDYLRDLGFPGEYPFTRGVYETMYLGRPWTMRQFSGFGSARDTNRRYRFLIDHGQTGLSVAFDMPTLMGYDSDHALARGEVGREGVAVCTLEDMETLFDGIRLDRISTSMTINGPAIVLLAFYVAVAEKQGVPASRLRGTIQNDILKEYQAQKEYLFPPRPSMRLVTDTFAWCARRAPKFHPISISGYHIREAGSTAVQELAFTLANGFAYVEAALAAGLKVDEFAPRLSFFFNAHQHFFEEIAKYRAARVLWARRLRDRYGARKPGSLRLRFHTQTAGVSLTAQQPENNIARTAYEALSAVLGGTQSLHTNSFDEALALPTERAVKIALRTQQVIAHELGVTDVIDPLGGSWYVEALTRKMIDETGAIFRTIDGLGGVVPAVEQGYFQREIARSAYAFQKAVEEKRRLVVGVNAHVERESAPTETLRIDPKVEGVQARAVGAFKRRRAAGAVAKALDAVRRAAGSDANLMPPILEAVRKRATLGEIVEVLRGAFGTWKEPPTYW